MRFSRFDYAVWAALGGLALALAVMLIGSGLIGLRPPSAAILDGGQIGPRQAFSLTFAEPMDAASVEANFSLIPAIEGQLGWQGQQMWFQPRLAWSAGSEYTAVLAAGARGQSGRQIRQDLVVRFSVRPAYVVYLSPASGPSDLWRRTASGDRPAERLTDTGGEVYDFAMAPDGSAVVFSRTNDRSGIDLWRLTIGAQAELLLDCQGDLCTSPAWSPDGAFLAYTREERGLSGSPRPSPPRVWTMPAGGGRSSPLFEDSQVLGFSPSFSPDGRRLAFFDSSQGGIHLIDLQTGAEEVLPTPLGQVGAWSPDGSQMLFPLMAFAGEVPTVELYAADLEARSVSRRLSAGGQYRDFGVPAWSPDGQWILLGVQVTGGGPGRQLWLMRPDGGDARPLLAEAEYSYGAYAWDPWGTAVVVQRFPLNLPNPQPEVLVIEPGSGSARLVAVDAWLPRWQP
jgi:TolB protein